MPSQEQGVIKFKVLKAKSQKTNNASAKEDGGRTSINTMDSSFNEVDIEAINDPQIQVVYQGMAQATRQGTNYERIFNEEYLVKIKNKESLQDRVAVQVLDQGTLVGELKVKANTLLNGGEQWYPLFNGNTPVGQLKIGSQFQKGAQHLNDPSIDRKWSAYKAPQGANESKIFEEGEAPTKMDFTQAMIFPAQQRRPDNYYDKMSVPIKTPKVEKPKIEAPKIKAPEIKAPVIKKPEIKAPVIKKPEIKAPKLEGPKVPKVGCCGGCGKMACCGTCCKPRVTAPEMNLKAPKMAVPKLKAPEIKAPKLEGPKVPKVGCCAGCMGCGGLACCGTCCKPKMPKAPEMNLKAPSVDLKGPKFEGPKAPKVGCCSGGCGGCCGKLSCMKCCGAGCMGCGGLACCGSCCKPKMPKAPEMNLKAPKMNAPKAPKFEGPKMAAPKTPYCGACCKPKAPKTQYDAVGNGFAVIPIHNAEMSNNISDGKHPQPGYAIVPISKKDQQKLLNQKIQASNVITSMKDKEVLGTNGYAVLPFEKETPGAPTPKPVEVKRPEVKRPEVPAFEEPELPKAEMKKPVMSQMKYVEVPKAEIPKVKAPEIPKVAAPKIEAPVIPKAEIPKIKASEITAPVIAAPVMAAPVMAAPVMAAPVMAAPVMAAPVIAAPVMSAPVMNAPKVEAPIIKKPELPPVQPITYEVPQYQNYQAPEVPNFDVAPKQYEAPKYEMPKYEAPKVPTYTAPEVKAPEIPKYKAEIPEYKPPQIEKYQAPALPTYQAPYTPQVGTYQATDVPSYKAPAIQSEIPSYKAPEIESYRVSDTKYQAEMPTYQQPNLQQYQAAEGAAPFKAPRMPSNKSIGQKVPTIPGGMNVKSPGINNIELPNAGQRPNMNQYADNFEY